VIVPLLWVALLLVASVVYWNDSYGLADRMDAERDAIFLHHEYWRAFTALGAHADLKHYLSNAAYVGGLGWLLRAYFGALVFPWLALIGGAASHALTVWGYPSGDRLLGASGMVYWMAAFWLASYFLIERKLSWGRRLVNCAGFTLILLVPETFEPAVSYRAHAVGFVLGLLFGVAHFLFRRREFRAAEVWVEDPPELEAEFPDDGVAP
jgi:rhomboid protease GluP